MENTVRILFRDNTWVDFPLEGLPPGGFNMQPFKNMIIAEGGILTPKCWIPADMIKMVFLHGAINMPTIVPAQTAPSSETKQ